MTKAPRWQHATITLVMAASFIGCATSHRIRRPEVAIEERGAVEMRALMNLYQQDLRDGDLETAAEILNEIEDGLRGADPHLRSHPEFEDMLVNTKKGRTALLGIRMKNLAAQRASAFEDASAHAQELEDDLDPASLESLEDKVEALEALTADGEQFRHITQFLEYDEAWRQQVAELARFHSSMHRVRQASDAVAQPIADGQKSIDAADLAASTEDELRHLERAAGAFGACRKRSESFSLPEGLALHTPLGRVSIDEVRIACARRETDAVARLENSRWTKAVESGIEALSDTHRALTSAATPGERLDASKRGIDVYGQCATELAQLAQHEGFDNTETFYTPFGHLSLSAIQTRCEATQGKLAKNLPRIQWRMSVDAIAERVSDANRSAGQAKRSTAAADKAEHLSVALGGFSECSERAAQLARSATADRSMHIETDLGRVTVVELARQCIKRHQMLQPYYKKALKYAKQAEKQKRRRAQRSQRRRT